MPLTHPLPGLQEDLASPVSCLLLTPGALESPEGGPGWTSGRICKCKLRELAWMLAGDLGSFSLIRIPEEAELEGTNIPTHLDSTLAHSSTRVWHHITASTTTFQQPPAPSSAGNTAAGGGGGGVQLP